MFSTDEFMSAHSQLRKSTQSSKFIIFLLLTVLGLVVFHPQGARAQQSVPEIAGYQTLEYTSGSVTSEPTEEKPESKLWYNDGFWWGVLWDSQNLAYRVHRFDLSTQSWVNTGTDIDDRSRSSQDVLWDNAAQKLYIASRAKLTIQTAQSQVARLYRYSYNSATDTYTLDSGFPTTIMTVKVRALVITKDSTGQLWATWTDAGKVMLNQSTDDGATWGTEFVLPTLGNDIKTDASGLTLDISSICAFNNDRIGVLWGNQLVTDEKYYFSVHRDNNNDTTWDAREIALQGSIGNAADDHINLATTNGTVLAVVKSDINGATNPLIRVLKRDPSTAVWSAHLFGTRSDNHTRPTLLFDSDTDSVYVFAKSSTQIPGVIYYKAAHISNLNFESGIGRIFMQGVNGINVNNPTSTKQLLNSSTGLLLLASDKSIKRYTHNYMALGGNFRPIANDDNATAPQNTPTAINVLANDTDAAGSIDPTTVVLVDSTSSGTVSIDAVTGVITYTPNPGFLGTDSFKYTVKDNSGESAVAASVTISVNVNVPPVANNDSANTNEDNSVDIDVTANDTDSDGLIDVTTVSITSPPTRGSASVNPSTGVVTYSPNLNFIGQDTLKYSVKDNSNSSSNEATVVITVNDVNDNPVAADDVSDTNEDTAVAIDVLANDSDVDGSLVPSTVTVTSGPANGATSINPATGEITYLPNTNFNGVNTFTYTVNDDDGASSNTATVTVTVNAVNDNPIASDDAASTSEETPVDVDVSLNDNDVDGALVLSSVTVVGNPANGSTSVNISNGVITYTPALNFVGTDSFTYTITDNDGGVSNTATVTMTVSGLNDPPTAVDDVAATAEDNPQVIDVLANDSDIDGTVDPTTVVVTSGPGNGTTAVNPLSGLITYTPNQNYNGADSFTYTVKDNDAATSNAATVTLTVSDVNDPPLAADDAASTSEDTQVLIDVLANDSDLDGSLVPGSVTVVSAPTNGTTSVNSTTGEINYAPNTNFSGSDSFIYRVDDDDGASSNTATVTVTVLGNNDPPVAADDVATTNEDTSVDINVVSNDTDVDGTIDPVTVTVSAPASGSATAQANGLVTYTPNADFFGTDTFTYTVNDNDGAASNTATVTVTVTGVNDPPVAVDDAVNTNQNQPAVIDVAANDTDIDGPIAVGTVSVTSGPANGATVVNGTTGEVTYTPNAGYSGPDSFTYTVQDNGGALSNQATVTISVNDLPVAVDDASLTTEDIPVTINVISNDSDSDGTLAPGTVTVTSGPGNGATTVNTATGEVTYDPSPNFFGADSFTYTVSDNLGGTSNQATVTITVNRAPIAVNDSPNINEDVATDIAVTANDIDLDGTLDLTTVTILTGVTHGTTSVNATTGVVTYSPGAEFSGSDSFTYQVNDNLGTPSNVATVSITVNAVNDPPVAVDDAATTQEDTPVDIPVATNDTDIDGTVNTTSAAVASAPTNGSVTVNPTTGLMTYIPNQDFFGTDSFTYTIEDDLGASSNAATVSITISGSNDPPVAVDDAASTDEGANVDVDVTANDSDLDGSLDPTTVVVVSAPQNGATSVDPVTGVVTYMPNPAFSGTDTFSYTVNDNNGASSNAATVTVSVNDLPVANNDAAQTDENNPVAIDVLANDADSDGTLDPATVNVLAGPVQGTVTLNTTTGVVTYTPSSNFFGSDSFIYNVSDNNGGTSNQATVSISVNDLPAAVDDVSQTDEDVPVTVDILVNDSDGDGSLVPATVTIVSGVTNGTTSINSTTGAITYTPNAEFFGSDTFTYTVDDNDGGTTNQATVSLTINEVNDAPVAGDDAATTGEDTPVVVDVVVNDSDIDGTVAPTTVAVVSNPGNGATSVDAFSGAITYTPNLDFFGTDTFTYTIGDDRGGTSNPATVTVNVTGDNDAPVAADDAVAANEDNAVTIHVLANDSDVDGSLDPATVTVVTGVNSGSTAINPVTGEVTYTPNLDFFGTDTFTYTVNDNLGSLSNVATVTITVNSINDAPVAVDDNALTNRNASTDIAVTTNDTDVDGSVNPVTVSATAATNGTIGVLPGGVVRYTPLNGFTGTDAFTYTVKDNNGTTSNEATVTVTVNDFPIAVDDAELTNRDTALDIDVVSNDTDSDGTIDPATVVVVSGPGAGATSVDPTTGLVTYTPNTGFAGSDSFTYTVNDNDGATSNAATVSLTVNDFPVAGNDAAQTHTNIPVAVDVISNDTDPDGTVDATTVSVTTPANNGLTSVDPVTGAITYTSNANFFGTDVFSYRVNDDHNAPSNAATVTVEVNAIPVAVDDSQNTTEDTPVDIDVSLNDTDADGAVVKATVSIITDVTNGVTSLNPTTGIITYTPNANFFGADSFTYTIDDNDGATSNVATATINVGDANDPPVAADDAATTAEDTPVDINVTVNDSDLDGSIDVTTVAIVTSPINGTAVPNPTTGVVTYTPNVNFESSDSFTYTVKDDDAGVSNAATVTVTVTSDNDASVAQDDAATTDEDVAVVINVLANDSDVDGTLNVASVAVQGAPTNGTTAVDATTGAVTYTPNANFFGIDSFSYTVQDNEGLTSNLATVTVTVTDVNDAPVAVDDASATGEDTPVTIDVVVNDSDVDGTLNPATVTVQTAPTNGTTAVDAVTGVVTYTPNTNFEGTDSFTYTLNDDDAASSNVATVTVTVTSTNDAPVAQDDTATTDENVAVVINVLANDSDVDGTINPATVAIQVSSTNGTTAIDAATGAVTYTPNANVFGVDSFSYTVQDNEGLTSNLATVTVTVNDAPVAVNDAATTGEDTPVSIDILVNDSDSDGTLNLTSVTIQTAPTNGATAVDVVTGVVTYTPNANFAGTDSFTYTVKDDDAATSNAATVTVTVTGENDAPVAQDDVLSTNEDVAVVVDVLANDSDVDNTLNLASVVVQGAPTNGSTNVDGSTGAITYTPNLDFIGIDTFTYTVQDNSGLTSNAATVTVTVTSVNDPPVAQSDAAATEANTPVDIDVLANDFGTDGVIDPTTVSIASAPFNGSASVNPVTGVITYTPDTGFSGADAFTYTVGDNNGLTSNPAAVTVSVSDHILPTDDSFVRSAKPTNNYGGGLELRVRKPNSGNVFTFLKFNITSITGPVQSAKIRLFVQDGGAEGGAIRVVSNNFINTSTPWTEDQIIWNNAPDIDGIPLDTVGPVSVGQIVEYDVTAAITGNGVVSFGIRNNSSDTIRLGSKESANPPILVIESTASSPLSPTLVSFSPASGPVGTEVTITGTNLNNSISVAFNGVSSSSFTPDSNSQLRATVPTGATTGKISITNTDGAGSSSQNFTVILQPAITSFTPISGPVATQVTISGNNLTGTTNVSFNGTSASSFTVNSGSQIVANVPPATTTGPISVTNAAGTSASISDFTLIQGPVVTSFNPTGGPIGTEVTLSGNNFTGSTQVAFNGLAALNFTVDSDTQLRATVPNGATSGPISVTNAAATGASTSDFTILAPPVVSSFTPAGGLQGTEVTISGGNFTSATDVAFNGSSAAAMTIDSDSQIRATVPNGATTGPISVVNNIGTGISSSDFTVTPPPTLSSFTPSEGVVGTEVTIFGNTFFGATGVAFNGNPASSFTVDSNAQIRATVPGGASTGKISVTNVAGPGESLANFIVLSGSGTFTFQPVEDAYVRSSAPTANFGGGDLLRARVSNSGVKQFSFMKFDVTGLNGPVQSATIRLFVKDGSSDGGSIFSVSNNFSGTGTPWDENALTFNNAPAISGTPLSTIGSVTTGSTVEFDVTGAVTGNGSFSFGLKNNANNAAEYDSKDDILPPGGPPELIIVAVGGSVNAPAISSFSPTGGIVGTEVTIAGSNFTGSSDVSFGGIPASTFVVDNDSQIRAIVNTGTATGKISATNADGTGLSVGNFFIVNTPTVTSFSPNSGAVGTEVTVTGSNFTGANQVAFNGTAASVFTVDSDTQMRVTVPNGSATGPVSVQNAAGAGISPSDFTVIGAPTITSFTPVNGAVGVEVTLTGNQFSTTLSVAFNGTPASGFIIDSDTQLRASVPFNATSGPLSVVNAAGTGISNSNFTVDAPPQIASFTPTTGVAGTEVTISGGNFTGATNVSFNGTAASSFTVDSDSQIRANVSALTTSGPVSVANTIGTGISAFNFTFVQQPTITSFSPNNGPVGTEVTISGSNFSGTTGVAFNGTSAPVFTVDSDAHIRANVPSGATTGPITVTNAAGSKTSANSYTITNTPSTITLTPTDDAYVHSGRPTRNHASAHELRVRLSSNDLNSYFKFNVTGLNGPPQSATLRLFVINDGPDGGSIYSVSNHLKNSSTPWQEENIIFDNAPNISGAPIFSIGQVALNQFVEFDVTSAIIGDGIYSFAISNVSNNLVNYNSKESTNPPELLIQTSGGSSSLPTITSFTPITGTVGTEVTITGFNFTGANAVAFNGVAAAGFTLDSDNQIRANVPTGAGNGTISVTTPSGAGVSASDFTLLQPPSISSFSPTNGPVATEVTLTGARFTGTSNVSFNGTSALSFTIDSDTQLRASVPNGATTGAISVTNADGTGVSSGNFSVNNAPVITSFSPTSSAVGALVTIFGNNFSGVTDVSFNGASATFTTNAGIQITATVPNGAATGLISVTNSDGTGQSATDFAVISQPNVSSFSPATGPVGTEVTIIGSNFTGMTGVTFNGTPPQSFAFDSDNQVRAQVPAGASTGPISISNLAGTGISSSNFIVTQGSSTLTINPSDDSYVRSSRPTENFGSSSEIKIRKTASVNRIGYLKFTVTGISGPVQNATVRLKVLNGSVDGGTIYSVSNNLEGSGVPWDESNISWSNAPLISGAPLSSAGPVSLNGFAEFDVSTAINSDGVFSFAIKTASSDLANYSSKEGATTPELVINMQGGGGTSSPPTISSFTPTAGPLGTEVTINGTNLNTLTSVSFNGTPAASFAVDSNLQVRATVATGATTGAITVANPDGSATSANAFSVLQPPTITSFTPANGPLGTEVTITGSNFSGLTAVNFNGTPVSSFSLDSDSQVRADVPSGATSGPVSVSNAVGSATSSSHFTVTNIPGVSSFTPTSGAIGAEITLTGVNFTGATNVTFNGASAAFTANSDTQILANVPSGASSGPISVTNSDGTGISADNFTVVAPPTIASFTPSSGAEGTEVTLTGANFVGVTSLSFNATSATSFTFDSPTQIRANVPTGATTGPISVTNAAGTAISASDFTVGAGFGTFTFLTTDDAYVRSSRPTENFGNSSVLKVRTTSSVLRNGYLKFVVSGLSGPVQNAKVRLRALDGSVDGGSIFSVSNNLAGSGTQWTEANIEWSNAPAISGAALSSIGAVTTSQTVEMDVTSAVTGNGTFSFAVKNGVSDLITYSSKEGSFVPELVITTGVAKPVAEAESGSEDDELKTNGEVIPEEIALYPNYPNPFNIETNIQYALPHEAKVKLGIFNLRGQFVRLLVEDEKQKAGMHTVRWNGRNAENKEVASGVYFLRLEIAEQKFSRKITLQK